MPGWGHKRRWRTLFPHSRGRKPYSLAVTRARARSCRQKAGRAVPASRRVFDVSDAVALQLADELGEPGETLPQAAVVGGVTEADVAGAARTEMFARPDQDFLGAKQLLGEL